MSVNRTVVQFMIDMRRLDVVDHYTYLGLLLTEFLDVWAADRVKNTFWQNKRLYSLNILKLKNER